MAVMQGRPRKKRGTQFWDKEYARAEYLDLSGDASEDLQKFCRWMEREYGRKYLNPLAQAVDIGCGNGRNLIWLSKNYGVRGLGYDTSVEAIKQARKGIGDLPIAFDVYSMREPIPLPDHSQMFALDMMASHVLKTQERERLRSEIIRVLRPDGWLFLKTFLLDEDSHASRLLRDYPGDEPHSYMHPEFGVQEFVFDEDTLIAELEPQYIIHKVQKSFGHVRAGKPHKRRSISIYAQKRH